MLKPNQRWGLGCSWHACLAPRHEPDVVDAALWRLLPWSSLLPGLWTRGPRSRGAAAARADRPGVACPAQGVGRFGGAPPAPLARQLRPPPALPPPALWKDGLRAHFAFRTGPPSTSPAPDIGWPNRGPHSEPTRRCSSTDCLGLGLWLLSVRRRSWSVAPETHMLYPPFVMALGAGPRWPRGAVGGSLGGLGYGPVPPL